MKKLIFALAVLTLVLFSGCAKIFDGMIETIAPNDVKVVNGDGNGGGGGGGTSGGNTAFTINCSSSIDVANLQNFPFYVERSGSSPKHAEAFMYTLLAMDGSGSEIVGQGTPWGQAPGYHSTGETPLMIDFSSLSINGVPLALTSTYFHVRLLVALVFDDGTSSTQSEIQMMNIALYTTAASTPPPPAKTQIPAGALFQLSLFFDAQGNPSFLNRNFVVSITNEKNQNIANIPGTTSGGPPSSVGTFSSSLAGSQYKLTIMADSNGDGMFDRLIDVPIVIYTDAPFGSSAYQVLVTLSPSMAWLSI